MKLFRRLASVVLGCGLCVFGAAEAEGLKTISVRLDGVSAPAGGRLVVVAKRASEAEVKEGSVPIILTINRAPDSGVTIGTVEAAAFKAGDTITVRVDDLKAYPGGFAKLPPGRYFLRPILDVNRNFAFSPFPDEGDITGAVTAVDLPKDAVELTLKMRRSRPPDPLASRMPPSPEMGPEAQVLYQESLTLPSYVRRVDMRSRRMSAFKGAPTDISAYVLLPPNYRECGASLPVIFKFDGFGGRLEYAFDDLRHIYRDMAAGRSPPMVWVFVDHATNVGTHEFADSANNGPWGTALVQEFIPWLQREFPIARTPKARFLTGHSSGGWAALWLQVRYPEAFGGVWAVAPDPVDFREFTNTDIYAPGANVYRDAAGAPKPLQRSGGRVVVTFEQWARYEEVLGRDGGQFASFDWVFSPRGPDGRPQPLFDWATGDVDPKVAAHWRENYDIAHILQRDGDRLRRKLDGRIRVIVGDQDSYYLDAGVHRLAGVLEAEGIKADIRFLPGRDHASVLYVGKDTWGLSKVIAAEAQAAAKDHVAACAAT